MKTTLNGSRLNVISFLEGSAAQREERVVEQDLLELKYVAKTKLNLARHLPVQSNGLNLLLNSLTPTENGLDKKELF